MQKKRYIPVVLTISLLLSSCARQTGNDPALIPDHTNNSEVTVDHIPAPPEWNTPDQTDDQASHESEIPDPENHDTEDTVDRENIPSQPLHSEWYLPHCTTEQLVEYFEEVVLNIEYNDGTGSANLVQKWLAPIYYRFYGTPTDTDKEVLYALFDQLNAIPGFPGIYAAADGINENVSISFLDPAAFRDSFSHVIHGEDAYGAVQFWYYTLTNELHTARIGYRTDIDQTTRNSVLIEEIINILGITDTTLRPDSITYQYANDTTVLSDVDWVILKLLYDPSIQCGMNADDCAAIIQDLYY